MSDAKHVVVVGGGIIGLCVADSLLTKGYRVTVLERDSAPGEGASCGNGGLIVPSHFEPLAAPGMIATGMRMLFNKRSPFGIDRLFNLETAAWLFRFARAGTKAHVAAAGPVLRDLNLASLAAYEELASEHSPPIGFGHRGLLMLCETERSLEGEIHVAKEAERLGLRTEVVNLERLKELQPGLTMNVAGGVHFVDDAHLSPPAVILGLRDRIRAKGGKIHDATEASGFRTEANRVVAVKLSEGEIEADEFVLASGAWSGHLARDFGLRLPLLAGKGYGFTVNNPPEPLTIPAILTGARVAVTPMPDGVRFVGTMELGPPRSGINPNRVEGMKASIPGFFPAFAAPLLEGPVWSGLRPCSPDGLPYLGRTARFSNMIISTGHAMMGMSLGPITGKLIAQIIAGEKPSIPLELLSPDRYA